MLHSFREDLNENFGTADFPLGSSGAAKKSSKNERQIKVMDKYVKPIMCSVGAILNISVDISFLPIKRED